MSGKRSSRRAAVLIASTMVFALPACSDSPEQPPESCAAQVAEAEQAIRNDRHWTDQDLPGIGEYVEVHWQTRVMGDPCSRAPGPTDYEYQGVVRLRPGDADALAAGYDWQPPPTSTPGAAASPDRMWPALNQFVPAGTRWLRSEAYVDVLPARYWGAVFLDPDKDLAFFVLTTH